MKYKLLTIFLTSLYLISCSSSSDVAHKDNFKIDYFTSGGIAGRSSGFTIYANGKVHFWDGATAANRLISDSTQVEDDLLNKISDILQDSTILSYNYRVKGNLTSILRINSNESMNSISFSGTTPPQEFPDHLKNLIYELNKVSNKK